MFNLADLYVRNTDDTETERTLKTPEWTCVPGSVETRVQGTKIFVLLSPQKRRKVKKSWRRHENSSCERKWLT